MMPKMMFVNLRVVDLAVSTRVAAMAGVEAEHALTIYAR